ncbi:hypothetical protein DYB28_002679 [Aphanomyces astaci]|uniref:Uncharacterized protein n=1 Tax=Aphanomyces astaci TaxID=112090 RepID=A0A9X8DV70_APHAT|nr:hypothetical protein DYB28_002679 [Aphanomyces astaci]
MNTRDCAQSRFGIQNVVHRLGLVALVPTTPLARTGTDVPTLTLARTGTDGLESDTETLESYSIPVPGNTIVATITVATGGIRDIQKAYEEFTRGIEDQQRTVSLLFFQQANEDRARLLGVQESQLVEMADGLLRTAETHESRRQDEFQKALTYLRDCYSTALRREAEKNALSWEDRTRELEQQLALKWEQREALLVRDKDSDLLVARRLHEESAAGRTICVTTASCVCEELRTLKLNHQEEILLVREAARGKDISKGVAYDLLHSLYDRDLASARDEVQSKASELESVQESLRDLSFRESANVACGNCPILEREKQDLHEALRNGNGSEETARELQESILTEQNRYEQTLVSEQGRRQDLEQLVQEQFMTLTQERAQSGEDPSPRTRDQLERERHANEEVLRQVEEARSYLKTEKLQLRDQEATLFRERSVQDLTLSQAYAELERQGPSYKWQQ